MFCTALDGTRIFYERRKGKKQAMVFVHGLLTNWTSLKPQIDYFHKLGHDVLYIDLRGHGKSDAPENAEDYHLDVMQQDLYAVLRKENIAQCILVGHSMGGMVSTVFTLKHPETVSKLVLIDSSYKNPLYTTKISFLRKHKKFAHHLARFLATHSELVQEHFPALKPRDFSKMRDKTDVGIIARGVANTPLHAIFSSMEAMFHYDAEVHLRDIKAPTLVIGSENDEFFSKRVQSVFARMLPRGFLSIQPSAHFNIIKTPKEINKAIEDFIA